MKSPFFNLFVLCWLFLTCYGINELIDGNNNFGMTLLQNLRQESENIMISPYSIESCLSILYVAAQGNTQTQMKNTLNFPDGWDAEKVYYSFQNISYIFETEYDGTCNDTNAFESCHSSLLRIAQRIYSNDNFTINRAFIDQIGNDSFKEVGMGLNEQNKTVKDINNWISNQTNGLINQVVDSVTSDTVLLAINTILLNTTWYFQFEESYTSLNDFYTSSSRKEISGECHMMHQIEQLYYYENDDFQFIKLFFSDEKKDLFMVIALPIKSSFDFNELDSKLDFIDIIDEFEKKNITLAIPKLEFSNSFKLRSALSDMGMSDAFDKEVADFSITNSSDVYISDVYHDTYFKMDEYGVTAAAVTVSIVVAVSWTHEEPILFKADHPFILSVIDGSTNTMLFLSVIENTTIPFDSIAPFNESDDGNIWFNYASSSSSLSSPLYYQAFAILFFFFFNL